MWVFYVISKHISILESMVFFLVGSTVISSLLLLATALLPIIAGYQLSPDRIQMDITSPK